MSSLENDMICLIDSLQYLKDDSQQQVQALEHLADMCLQDTGAQIFQKTGGFALVLKKVFRKGEKPLVLQKSLVALGNASLTDEKNKAVLCTDQLLKHIQMSMLKKGASQKLIAATAYFLACLCSGSEKAQNKARKTRCMESLISLYRKNHPVGNSTSQVEEWFEDRQPSVLLHHLSHALRAMLSKPTNRENQKECSRLLNLAISSLTSTKKEIKTEALHFISDCLYENEESNRIFNMVGGVRYLGDMLKKQMKDNEQDTLAALLDTLTIVVTDSSDSKSRVADLGILALLVKCLAKVDDVKLKCMICISECVHENEKCQNSLLQCDGVPIVINIMSNNTDDLVSKVGTSILQSCVKTMSDFDDRPVQEPTKGTNNSGGGFAGLLNFFTNRKSSLDEAKPKSTSLKKVLEQFADDKTSQEQIDQLVQHIEKGGGVHTEQKKKRKSNLRNDKTVHNKNKNDSATESEMLTMLREQQKMLANFKSDFDNLRTEMTSQISECNGSIASVSLNKESRSKENQPPSRTDSITQNPQNDPPVERSVNRLPQMSSTTFDERPALNSRCQSVRNQESHPNNQVPDHNNNIVLPDYNTNEVATPASLPFPHPDVAEWVQQWRQQSFNDSSFNTTLNTTRDSNDNMFKVPVFTPMLKRKRTVVRTPLSISTIKSTSFTPSKLKSTPDQFAFNDECFNITPVTENQNRFPEKFHYAPKKTIETKSVRPTALCDDFTPSRDNSTRDAVYRPIDHTKRSLNFAQCEETQAKKKLRWESNSGGFVGSSHCIDATKEADNSCLACISSPELNSRNVWKVLRNSENTCNFHSFLAVNFKIFVCGVELPAHSKVLSERRIMPSPRHHHHQDRRALLELPRAKRQQQFDNKSVCSNWSSVTSSGRRLRKEYSKEEVNYILDGVERYGKRWTAILNSYPFQEDRRAIDLSGKYKQMKKLDLIGKAPVAVVKSPQVFTTQELVNLRRGVYEHGQKWDVILARYNFLDGRTAAVLEEKWKLMT